MKRIHGPISNIIFAAILLLAVHAVHADVVSDWNAIAVQSTITGSRPGPTGVIDLAMVHAAMYDAVQAIERRYEPYYVEVPGASGNPTAAAARAARDVLVSEFPAQTDNINMTYLQYLTTHNIPADDPGVAVGITAAAGIIAVRACDGAFPTVAPPPFIGGTGIGVWRPTPPANLPMQAPWLGNVTPFLMTRPSQFRAEPPPAVSSRQYARDYIEVKSVGASNSSTRTPESGFAISASRSSTAASSASPIAFAGGESNVAVSTGPSRRICTCPPSKPPFGCCLDNIAEP